MQIGVVYPQTELRGDPTAVRRIGKSVEDLGRGRHLFSGTLVIDRSGSFGYTVRVLPKHEALASKAELGLIVNA